MLECHWKEKRTATVRGPDAKRRVLLQQVHDGANDFNAMRRAEQKRATATEKLEKENMPGNTTCNIRWGMVINLDRCTGCGTCMVACQAENNIPPAADASHRLRTINWLLVFQLSNNKPFPEHDMVYLPRPCQQCAAHPCAKVCPVNATERDEEGGIVSQVYPRCIGCRYCMTACPYHSRYFNWFDPVWPKGLEKNLTPDVSPRPRGVVEKCTFCHHRYMRAKDALRAEGRETFVKPIQGAEVARHSAIPEDGYVTACAEACPNGVITFGDLNNPAHKVHALKQSPHAFRLLERLGTDPSVYYLSARAWVRRLGDNYLDDEMTQKPREVLWEEEE